MHVIRFSAHGTANDVTFSVTLESDAAAMPGQVSAILTAHDEIESDWIATIPLTRQAGAGSWSGVIAWAPHDAPELLSLAGLQVSPIVPDAVLSVPPPQPLIVEVHGDLVLCKPGDDGTGNWSNGKTALEQLVLVREARFDVELAAPSASASDPLWSVAVLAEHVLLTVPTRVPGLRVLPLQRSSNDARLGATADVLTAVAGEIGMLVGGAVRFSTADRPLALVEAPRLRASTGQEAMQEAALLARRLLDIICLNRGDSPAVLAAAVGRHQPHGTVVLEGGTTLDRRYRGNLLGGFISGESVSVLNRQWSRAQADARISLWLRLLNEALTDARWDYRAFRCFNLIEGISKEVLPKKSPVHDATGFPRLQVDGKSPYTSAQARGAVYLVLQKAGHALPVFRQRDGSTTQADLWDETELWVAIRNEVAHTGSWENSAGQVPSEVWRRHNARLLTSTQRFEVARAIQSAAESVLHAAFGGTL